VGIGFQPSSRGQCSDGSVVSNTLALSAQAQQASRAICRRSRNNLSPWAIAEQSFAMKEAHMRIAEIDWPLFWQALNSLDPATRDHWLSRWVFADDAVKLSRQPAGDARRRL
jgi:hypothetical protein